MKKMKKNYKTRLLITLLIMVLMLFGCGNTQAETTPAPVPEEKEPEVVEETKVEEPEPEVVEDVQEETTETTEPSETEEVVAEDPGEVEYITGYLTIWEYTKTLDPSELCILIYNETDRYIINMKEGQHYQLKKGDKIYTMLEHGNTIGYGYDHEIVTYFIGEKNAPEKEMEIDYSKMTENQKFFIDRELDNGEIVQLTVYLDPPTD